MGLDLGMGSGYTPLQSILQKGYGVPQHATGTCMSRGAHSCQWHSVWVLVAKSTGGEPVLLLGQSSDGQCRLPLIPVHSPS